MIKIKGLVQNNAGLKVLALALAVVTWFYINGELNRLALEESMGIKGGVPYKIAAKTLPIVADVRGKVIAGYRVDTDRIIITPQVCNVIGVKRLLDKVDVIKTIPIYVGEYTKTATIRVSLESPAKGIKLVDRYASVVIPIEKETE